MGGPVDTLEVELACRQLAESTREVLRWAWEDRFRVMLTAFTVQERDQVDAALGECFGHRWQHDSPDMPDAIRHVTRSSGGLRPGQLLLTSDPSFEPMLYCMWWPWGGGEKVSLRVGCWTRLHGTVPDELEETFRSWF